MIDGVQFTFHTANPKTHLLGLPCWEVLIDEKTGQRINDVRSMKFRGLDIRLKPSMRGGYNLLVNGSLHKFHNSGEHNADQFTFSRLLQAIDSFTDLFDVDASRCILHGLEVGVNLALPYSPLKVFKNLVSFRSRPFAQINKSNLRKGQQCSLTQYAVKMYDKAAQSGVECGNVLRFEVAATKMQVLANYRLRTLADLQNSGNVYPLIELLKETMQGIIWTDGSANLDRLTNREQKQWLYFSNPKTWGALSKYQRKRAAKTWDKLLSAYGNPPNLLPFITGTWEGLFKEAFEAEKAPPFYQPRRINEAHEIATFLPLECTVKKWRHTIGNTIPHNCDFHIIETENINVETGMVMSFKKLCLSCGEDISNQNKRAVFCSERLHGKAAKRCRNAQSNKRRDNKTKIQKAMLQDSYLAITYFDEKGTAYTDILHPTELNLTKEWLDRIQRIEHIPFHNAAYNKKTL